MDNQLDILIKVKADLAAAQETVAQLKELKRQAVAAGVSTGDLDQQIAAAEKTRESAGKKLEDQTKKNTGHTGNLHQAIKLLAGQFGELGRVIQFATSLPALGIAALAIGIGLLVEKYQKWKEKIEAAALELQRLNQAKLDGVSAALEAWLISTAGLIRDLDAAGKQVDTLKEKFDKLKSAYEAAGIGPEAEKRELAVRSAAQEGKEMRAISAERAAQKVDQDEVIRPDILKIMDQHAANAQSRLADTKVSKLIFEQLNLALRHKVPLMITGDSRFGKTKAVSVWSEMRPGRVRLVTVPESNRDWDFFAAHADAFGIEYNDRTSIQRLKRSIQHVIQNSGFFICYDEAHFLTPVNYTTDTPPKRINWVRCQVIDKGVGCALFATPQSLSQTLEKYAAKTKYNLEQWFGRIAPPVVLADYYDRDELMAVAKIHFPEFPEKLLALICARAMQSEGYLKSMEFAARYASALASERQRRTPSMQDVDDAIERMMPTKRTAQTASEAPSLKRVSRPVKPASTRSLAPVLEDAGVVAGNTGQTHNFTSRRPGLVADLDRAEPLRADRALVPA